MNSGIDGDSSATGLISHFSSRAFDGLVIIIVVGDPHKLEKLADTRRI